MSIALSPTGFTRAGLDDTVALLQSSRGVLEAIKLLPPLMEAAEATSPNLGPLQRLVRNRASDPLAAYLAIRAIGHVGGEEAAQLLARLLEDDDPAIRQHAAWALSGRRPYRPAFEPLIAMIGEGGFSQMMAELTLEPWLREMPEIAWRAEGALTDHLLWLSHKPQTRPSGPRGNASRIAQVLMQGKVDATKTSAASGDGGGLITLQVGLTEKLAQHEAIAEAHLITRAIHGLGGGFTRPCEEIGDDGYITRIEFGPPRYLTRTEMWAHRAELERELERTLVESGPFDGLHLRFADVGTFAAARAAKRLGIPSFSLSPPTHTR